MSNSEEPKRRNRLIEIEQEVHAEAREWERRRLEQRLQEEANRGAPALVASRASVRRMATLSGLEPELPP